MQFQGYYYLEVYLLAGLLILGIISYIKSTKINTGKSFIFICISLAVHQLFNFFVINGLLEKFTILIPIDQINGILFPILFVNHIKDITKIKLTPWVLYAISLISTFVIVYYYILFLNMGIEEKNLFIERLVNVNPDKMFLIPIFFIQVTDLISIIYAIKINRSFSFRVKKYLSSEGQNSLRYVTLFVLVTILLYLLSVIFILFLPKQFAQFIMIPLGYFFFFFIAFIFYSDIPFYDIEQNEHISENVIYEESNIEQTERELGKAIVELMREKKLYKNPDISLFDLARELPVNSRQLSNYINHELKVNFSTLINKYRIEEAKELLLDNNYLTIDAIAELSGFRNRITLYRAFKKYEKISPSEYKNIKH